MQQLLELFGVSIAELTQKRWKKSPWAQQGHVPPPVLEGTFPCKWSLMESWLLVEQGFHDLPVPPRPALWPGPG